MEAPLAEELWEENPDAILAIGPDGTVQHLQLTGVRIDATVVDGECHN